MNLVNFRERVRLNSFLRVKRSLKAKGAIKASVGQVVEPKDILGTYDLSGGFTKVNLSRELQVKGSDVKSYLKKSLGDKIFKGELLASKLGVFGEKEILSPTDAILHSYNEEKGELTLQYLPAKVYVPAGVYGIVEQKTALNEVIIKTMAHEIFGIFGTGRQREGFLVILDGKGNLTSKQQITKDLKGNIVVSGALVYRDALQSAINLGVAALITGGLNLQDFVSIAGAVNESASFESITKMGTDIGTDVIVTEGFGPLPLGEDIFELVSKYNGSYCFAYGNSATLILPAGDPDVILKLRKVEFPKIERSPERAQEVLAKEVEVGQKVRLVWPPFMGLQGRVIFVDRTPTLLPSGISTHLLTIETKVKVLKVPFTNVEIKG